MNSKNKYNKKPKISIIIPTKNEEKNIKETIIQFTKYKGRYNIEVIVSDGKSSDNTVGIAKKYADVVVVHNKKTKQTIAEGRNQGANKSKGDLLIFIDAAVRVPNVPNLLEKSLEVYKKKGVAAATIDMYVYPWEENIFDRILYFIGNMIVRLSIITKVYIVKGECQIIKKRLFNKIKGYNTKLVTTEDSELYRRIAKYGKIVCLNGIKIYDSPRRFRKQGYLKTIWEYIIDNVSMLFRKKAVSKEWERVG